jgi:hypothetical protein
MFDLDADGASASAHAKSLGTTRDLMIQPYLTAVETEGERSLIFIDRVFSHSIIKAPFSAGAAGGKNEERDYVPGQAEIAFGERVLKVLGTDLLYARVDMIPTPAGPQLMELELIEPALFFGRAPGAAAMFVEALSRVVPERPQPRRAAGLAGDRRRARAVTSMVDRK